MDIETCTLVASIVLGLVYIIAASHAATKVRGVQWNLSARDALLPELTGIPARLARARGNFLETFPFFAAAILLVHATGTEKMITALGAQLYFWARIVYLPIYAYGIPVVRTLIWTLSIIGLLLVLAGLFIR